MKEYKGFYYYESLSEVNLLDGKRTHKICVYHPRFKVPIKTAVTFEDLSYAPDPDDFLKVISRRFIDTMYNNSDKFFDVLFQKY